MKDRKQRKINQKKSKKIEQVVQADSQIKTPSIAKADNLWWEQPSYKKNLTDSVYGPLRISEEGYVLKNNGDFPTSSPNELGLIDPSHLLIKPELPSLLTGNNLGITSTLAVKNFPWLGDMGLGVVGDTITLDKKSIQDLEKEEQKRLINQLNAEIKKQSSEIEDLKKTKEELELLKQFVTDVMKPQSSKSKDDGPSAKYTYVGLCMMENGAFYYKFKPLNLERMLRNILELLISRVGQIVSHDNIRDENYAVQLRHTITEKRIAQYVAKLRKALNVHFPGKSLPKSKKGIGWYLPIESEL